MLALRDAGVRVPADTLVSGWDDVMAARYAGLTTVRQPMRELGVRAAQLLDQLINRTRERTRPRGPPHRAHRPPDNSTAIKGTTPPAGGTTR